MLWSQLCVLCSWSSVRLGAAFWSVRVVFSVVFLMEGEPLPHSQLFWRLYQVFFQGCSAFTFIHFPVHFNQVSCLWWKKQHPPLCCTFPLQMIDGELITTPWNQSKNSWTQMHATLIENLICKNINKKSEIHISFSLNFPTTLYFVLVRRVQSSSRKILWSLWLQCDQTM